MRSPHEPVDVPETVSDAVRVLQAEGFGDDVHVEELGVRCGSCGMRHGPAQIVVHAVYRFEGASDPGDSAIVLGVECPACGARGIVVSAFGADADDQLLAIVNWMSPPSGGAPSG